MSMFWKSLELEVFYFCMLDFVYSCPGMEFLPYVRKPHVGIWSQVKSVVSIPVIHLSPVYDLIFIYFWSLRNFHHTVISEIFITGKILKYLLKTWMLVVGTGGWYSNERSSGKGETDGAGWLHEIFLCENCPLLETNSSNPVMIITQ